MSERPGSGNRDPRRGPVRGRGGGRPGVSRAPRPGSRGGSQPRGAAQVKGRSGFHSCQAATSSWCIRAESRKSELDYEEGMELWKAGDPESARDALRYALSACHDNLWIHVALGRIALEEFRDPTLARGHFGYAFELAQRALPPRFLGPAAARPAGNRPFYEAIDGSAPVSRGPGPTAAIA